jgi:hypothetical protein
VNALAHLIAAPLNRHGEQSYPLMPWKKLLHAWLLALAEPHEWRERVAALETPDEYYDVALARVLIAKGEIAPWATTIDAVAFTRHHWWLRTDGAVLSQGPKAALDLIWVLRMPPDRAAEPVLFFVDESRRERILDGCHRLARAVVDGKRDHPVLMIEREDARKFRRRWGE